ncbi:MAG TPA: bacillithiol biosynthesis cysteine-adding enzyme BshC [Vicinamibacterales bacterium]|jgi:bacillithiol biosynthesis cysteine-adding enzyme BshC|nr:bacillithiol biosynthesis cysteine-adding enzyme BshC [Vicinamibacterales bacterium]|tara:strand:+ start:1799 stop:3382 length:1584 start_codon:yes stop_codon:yes gene_type:complete
MRRLATEYTANFAALEPFFAGNPTDRSAWQHAIAARERSPAIDGAVTTLLRAQQQARGAPTVAFEATGRLDDPRAVAVVTGQQAGLFGGPLYTLLKAISAIRLARQVEQAHGVPAVAVFWVDAEDHDLDEIRSCGILDADLQLKTVSLAIPATAPGTPAASVRLGDEVATAVDGLAAALPETDFTPDLMAGLRHAYADGRGLVEAFAVWIEQLLGDLGLVVFDASDPAAKPLASALFEREIASAGTTTSLARVAGEQLCDAGFHAQVEPLPDSVALFLLEGTRHAIRQDGDRLRVGDEPIDRTRLLTRLRDDVACLGPNVLLRPIVQDRLFPTVCYVAGPNELAYLAQLKQVYTHFGVPMPLVAPRLSATLVDAAVIKFLRRNNIAMEMLHPQDESELNRLLGDQLPESVDKAMRAAEDTIRDRMGSLTAAVATVDPTLGGAAESTLGRMERDLRNLQNKVVQAAKRRDQTLRRQFARAQSQIFPQGNPQERAVGAVYFLNRYGPALIDRLVTDPTLDASHHWVITI